MKLTELRTQRIAGFRHLRFESGLEGRYRAERDHALRLRSRPVTAAALALFLLYALLDLTMLPAELARHTIAVRLFFTCPVIALVYWLSYRPITLTTFVRSYTLAYMAGGFSVVLVIGLARQAQHPMPYDGILLMLMFGYFVMGLPFRTVSVASAMIILAYLSMELATGMDSDELMTNGFFIGTTNIIGMVGSWLSEYRQRAHFLDRQMLDISRKNAEEESHQKTHLITVASHDLRQPLNVISLMLENLIAEGLPRTQSELVTKLKTSVAHFNSLLGSVLDISRIHEGMISPENKALDAYQALLQLQDACLEDARNRDVQLDLLPIATGTGVIADPQLLHRILQNLVVNSLEHSAASIIRLHALRQGKEVWFEVVDNGQGIHQDTVGRIFEPFFRAAPEQQPHSGLGLGLAIVKELTELMGGVCGVTSTPGQGSRFWVRFPATNPPALPVAMAPIIPGTAIGGVTLLVVEDHDETRHWLCETIKGWGYRTVVFSNAEQALAAQNAGSTTGEMMESAGERAIGRHGEGTAETFDLLVSDIHLPGISGRELFDALSRNGSIRGGILITADTSVFQGYDDNRHRWVMHKPLTPMRLRAAIVQLASQAEPALIST